VINKKIRCICKCLSPEIFFLEAHYIYIRYLFKSVDVNLIFVVIVKCVIPKYISFVRHCKKIFRMVSSLIHQIVFKTLLGILRILLVLIYMCDPLPISSPWSYV